MDTLLYAGSFDPVTRGHMDVIRRTAALCSQLVVAVMHNPEKHGFLSVPMRVELLETACRELPNVRVIAHGGLLVDCAHEVGAQAVIRGLRPLGDFESEYQMAQVNRKLGGGKRCSSPPATTARASPRASCARWRPSAGTFRPLCRRDGRKNSQRALRPSGIRTPYFKHIYKGLNMDNQRRYRRPNSDVKEDKMDQREQEQRPVRREYGSSAAADSIGQARRVIDQLEARINDARRVPMSKTLSIVDTGELIDLIGQLRIVLPHTVVQAQAILEQQKQILGDAKAEADRTADKADEIYTTTVEKAKQFEQEVKADADAYDKQIRQKAQEDSSAIIADANTRAEQIIFNAQQQSQKLVEDNEITRRAQAYAVETRERAERTRTASTTRPACRWTRCSPARRPRFPKRQRAGGAQRQSADAGQRPAAGQIKVGGNTDEREKTRFMSSCRATRSRRCCRRRADACAKRCGS